MKSVFKKIGLYLMLIWHCAVSFISPWCLAFVIYFLTDIHNDEYFASVFAGCVLLFIWLIAFLPSFLSLTNAIKMKKKLFAIIPAIIFVMLGVIGIATIGGFSEFFSTLLDCFNNLRK